MRGQAQKARAQFGLQPIHDRQHGDESGHAQGDAQKETQVMKDTKKLCSRASE